MNEYPSADVIRKDLNWVLTAPSLLCPNKGLWNPNQLQFNQPFVVSGTELASLSDARQGKLGRYFEALVVYLIRHSDRFHLLAKNRVISHNQQTLGELDLLLEDTQSNEIIHLELALKFYLWVPTSSSNAHSWVGSGLTDFLDTKVKRLFHHQMKLPLKARALGCWPSDLPFPTQHRLWMPGRLYVPFNQTSRQIPVTRFSSTPWALNANADVSYWYEFQRDIMVLPKSIIKADWLEGNPTNAAKTYLPAQFVDPEQRLPIYVLPPEWQYEATTIIQKYGDHHD